MDGPSNQAIIHHLENLTKNPTQSRFEIEEEGRDGSSKSTETRVVAMEAVTRRLSYNVHRFYKVVQ